MEINMKFPQKIKNWITIWSSNLTSGYISNRNETGYQRGIWTPMFTAASFTIAMTWKQPNCPSIMETPVLWPPHAKSWLTGKDSDAGRDWGQEKGMTEDEMGEWHHWLDAHESEWTPGDGDGQGGLACCDSRGCKESDTTEWLNWTDWTECTKYWESQCAKHCYVFCVHNFL